MNIPLSRREFFRQAPAGAATALLGTAPPPPRAWIIMEPNWHFNDEYTYAEGEVTHSTLYYDRAAAEAACRELNDQFYAGQTPAEFELDWATYFPGGLPDGRTEEDVTWDDVKQTDCWTDPFLLHELTIPGGDCDE